MSKQRIASHEGNKPSFDQLFVNYRPMMVFYARHLIKNEVVAEDLVTEVFVKCWKKQNDFANEFAALAFLRVSTRNACLNHLDYQRSLKQKKKSMLSTADDYEEPVLNEMIRTECVKEAWILIQRLPVACRRIVFLGYIKGIDNRKIAKRLHLSIHTVKNQKYQGLQMIKRLYREHSDKMDQAAVA